MSRDRITRAEVEQLLEEWSEELVKTLVKVLGPAGVEDPGLRAARRRAEELRAVDPTFDSQVQAVRKARESGAHITIGSDPGRRGGPGDFRVSEPAQDDDEGEPGSALAAIRRRRREGGE